MRTYGQYKRARQRREYYAARYKRQQQRQAARQRAAQQRRAARQAAREQQAEAAYRVHLDQSIAAAAAEIVAVIPAVLDDGAVRAIISDAVWTTDLDEHGGLDGAMQAAAVTAAGRIMTAVTEHDGTLPASPAALDAAFREIIQRSLTADFARKPHGRKAGPKRPWYRRKRVLIPAGVLIALWIIGATAGGSHPAASPAPSASAGALSPQYPASQSPASPAPSSPAPSHTAKPSPSHTPAPASQAPAPATQAPAYTPPATQAPAAATGTHRAGRFCGEHGITDASGLTCTLTASGTWHWEH